MSQIKSTHRIRWNGNKTGRIITFTPRFMKKLLTAKHDLAVRIVIKALLKFLGKNYTIDSEQREILDNHLKTITVIEEDYLLFKMQSWMTDGILMTTPDLDELFDQLNIILPAMYDRMKGLGP